MTSEQLDELCHSEEYAEYIMKNGSRRIICNGNMLLEAMESGYLFDEFVAMKETAGMTEECYQ